MRAKQVDFEVTYLKSWTKPDWFLDISPHGKVPVLKVDDEALFESNAIAEYLDETITPRLHPEDAIARARNRAWCDFVPEWSRALWALYAKDKESLDEGLEKLPKTLAKLEDALAKRGNDGPYFNGDKLSLVDAAYAPSLMRFAIVEKILKTGILRDFPLLQAWSDALAGNEHVKNSVPPEFTEAFDAQLVRRESYAATLMDGAAAAAAE